MKKPIVVQEEQYELMKRACIRLLTNAQICLGQNIRKFKSGESDGVDKNHAAFEAISVLDELKLSAAALNMSEWFYTYELELRHDDIVAMWNYIHPEEPIT